MEPHSAAEGWTPPSASPRIRLEDTALREARPVEGVQPRLQGTFRRAVQSRDLRGVGGAPRQGARDTFSLWHPVAIER